MTGDAFTPVSLSDQGIENFTFPQKREQIGGWIENRNITRIYEHGWGVWTALTRKSEQKHEGDSLLTFETWYAPEHIKECLKAEERCLGEDEETLDELDGRGQLNAPNQFGDTRGAREETQLGPSTAGEVVAFVKYNPAATKHTLENELYRKAALKKMWDEGLKSVPDYPNAAVTLKPVFHVASPDTLHKLKVWPGPPDDHSTGAGYGSDVWPDSSCVMIRTGDGARDPGGVEQCEGRVRGIDDFVHFTIDDSAAQYLNKHTPGVKNASAGDFAFLIAMHVTTKEIKRWTWQTFWWTPTPDQPSAPSSASIAEARPSQLTGAPSNYAMAVAYSMIRPAQPYTGGSNQGKPNYAYSPYLEAPFDSTTFSDVAKIRTPNKGVITNNSGIRTTCMSCHARAHVPMEKSGGGYIADTYVDMEGDVFEGAMKADFLWSIRANLIEAKASD